MHAIFACEESQNAQIYKWFWGTWFRSKFAKKKKGFSEKSVMWNSVQEMEENFWESTLLHRGMSWLNQ